MKAIYNNKLISSGKLPIGLNDRALSYGDGIFETIFYNRKPSPLFIFHLNRLHEGAQLLHFQLPDYLDEKYIHHAIIRLVRTNDLTTPVKVKIQVWRQEGGLYEPQSDQTNVLITVTPLTSKTKVLSNIGFAHKIYKSKNSISHLKTLNALPYILAGIEKSQRKLEDIILVDNEENIMELLFSNLFWIKDETFYTPSLSTGCIKGVMRAYLIDYFKDKHMPIMEVLSTRDALFNANYAFASNALGLAPILQIESKKFPVYPDLPDLDPHTAT